MIRIVLLLALVASASAADISAHTEMSKIGKSLSEALSRVKTTTDDASKARRSLLALDASFCGAMTTSFQCSSTDAASCAQTTGCVLTSGECELDMTQYDAAQLAALLVDVDFAYFMAKGESCRALAATQCATDVTCQFEGECQTDSIWMVVWLANKCPTMATLISKQLVAQGITQAQVHAEANASGISVSPEFQAAMNAEGVTSDAMALSSALFATLGAAAFALA